LSINVLIGPKKTQEKGNLNQMQSETADFALGAASLANSTKQHSDVRLVLPPGEVDKTRRL